MIDKSSSCCLESELSVCLIRGKDDESDDDKKKE